MMDDNESLSPEEWALALASSLELEAPLCEGSLEELSAATIDVEFRLGIIRHLEFLGYTEELGLRHLADLNLADLESARRLVSVSS